MLPSNQPANSATSSKTSSKPDLTALEKELAAGAKVSLRPEALLLDLPDMIQDPLNTAAICLLVHCQELDLLLHILRQQARFAAPTARPLTAPNSTSAICFLANPGLRRDRTARFRPPRPPESSTRPARLLRRSVHNWPL